MALPRIRFLVGFSRWLGTKCRGCYRSGWYISYSGANEQDDLRRLMTVEFLVDTIRTYPKRGMILTYLPEPTDSGHVLIQSIVIRNDSLDPSAIARTGRISSDARQCACDCRKPWPLQGTAFYFAGQKSRQASFETKCTHHRTKPTLTLTHKRQHHQQ